MVPDVGDAPLWDPEDLDAWAEPPLIAEEDLDAWVESRLIDEMVDLSRGSFAAVDLPVLGGEPDDSDYDPMVRLAARAVLADGAAEAAAALAACGVRVAPTADGVARGARILAARAGRAGLGPQRVVLGRLAAWAQALAGLLRRGALEAVAVARVAFRAVAAGARGFAPRGRRHRRRLVPRRAVGPPADIGRTAAVRPFSPAAPPRPAAGIDRLVVPVARAAA
jgi:hypothetical protein